MSMKSFRARFPQQDPARSRRWRNRLHFSRTYKTRAYRAAPSAAHIVSYRTLYGRPRKCDDEAAVFLSDQYTNIQNWLHIFRCSTKIVGTLKIFCVIFMNYMVPCLTTNGLQR
jgi:hypothetical protein